MSIDLEWLRLPLLREAVNSIIHHTSVKEVVEYLIEAGDIDIEKLRRKATSGSKRAILNYARAMHRADRGDELDDTYWRNVQRRNPRDTQIRAYFVNASQDADEDIYRVIGGHYTRRIYESTPDQLGTSQYEEDFEEDDQTLQQVINLLQARDYKDNMDKWRDNWETDDNEETRNGSDPGDGNWIDLIQYSIEIYYATQSDRLLYADCERFNNFLEARGSSYTDDADDWPKIDPTDSQGKKILRT